MMRKRTDRYIRNASVALAMTAVCLAAGCGSDPEPPDLTANQASTLVSQRWARDEPDHFTVTFHSDTLIGCGIQNDLWKRVETSHQGFAISTYQLTEAGLKALFAIDLKESGKFHEVILRGPYLVEVTRMSPGDKPDVRQVNIRWDIDWNKAPAGLKACFPRFELSGSQVALFQLFDQVWRFVSFLKPAEALPQAALSKLARTSGS
jgi:hypothetical protein